MSDSILTEAEVAELKAATLAGLKTQMQAGGLTRYVLAGKDFTMASPQVNLNVLERLARLEGEAKNEGMFLVRLCRE